MHFYSEGRWVNFESEYREQLFGCGDWNDYLFNSLECCEPQYNSSRIYIIIDGVLVDSCPKRIAEAFRQCD